MLKTEKKIAFIVDGNSSIGLGHLSRCKTIADELVSKSKHVTFIVPRRPNINNILSNYEYIEVPLDKWSNVRDNIKYFSALFLGIETIVLDLLEEDYLSFSFLKDMEKKLISITSFYYDEKNRYENISIFPGMEKINKDYIVTNSNVVRLYSGSEYIAIRKEFLGEGFNFEDQQTPTILVTMGGADPFNFTTFVVDALVKMNIDFIANIVIGSAAENLANLEEKCRGVDNIHIYNDVKNMSEMMRKSTIGIINGGITRYEMACVGLPFIALSIHKVQFNITELLTKEVGGVNMGIKGEFTLSNLIEQIETLLLNSELRRSISSKLRKQIDGNGTRRIATIIENITYR